MDSLKTITAELDRLGANHAERMWAQYTTGFDLGVQESLQKINDYQKNPAIYKVICDTLEKSKEPLEQRQAKILHQSFKKFHLSEKCNTLLEKIQDLENSLMDVLNKYRVSLQGREMSSNEITTILTESPDRDLRRQAYESRIPTNKVLVDSGFIQLLDLRKELAVASGHKNFVAYKLEEDELTPQVFEAWPQECARRRARYQEKTQKLAQHCLQVENLEPWDFSYLKTRLCSYNNTKVDMSQFFEPMAKTFAKFGFDIRSLNLTYDVFPRKNKSEWGYNFTIAIGKDSRVLANVTNMFFDYWVLLHETAHGVHFLGLNPEESALNYGVSGIVAEGFANYFGDLSYSREFLSEVFPADQAEEAYAAFKELEKIHTLGNFRSIAETLFDQALYLNDIQTLDDINSLNFSLYENLTGRKNGSSEPAWAHVIHHTSAPVYLHNYFLGDLMCDKMKHVYSQQNNGKRVEDYPLEFGAFWREKVLSPSGRYPFLDLYERVCGEKLSIGDYLDRRVLA